MNSRMSPDFVPSWLPASGHALRLVGVHFDAIRIGDLLGEQVAYELMAFTDFRAGPIVRASTRGRNSYFLLPPRTAAAYAWPVGAEVMGRDARHTAFVGVPALYGDTWPLDWRSLPCAEAPFVEPELLQEMVVRVVAGAT
ncbi:MULTISPECIES: hypothetical protein [Streptomyces]|uniref:DNA primase/polymerase bifunctional N-terminal domain-containing protein n=1 Tax=Streptomyces olivaceiscleroticus TaxID=68245 RepID=A0ABN1B3T7_9ACTN|nr:hypothetical protein [Streptomyces niger]